MAGKHRPGTTVQAVENEMVSLAMDLARKQLKEGTASSQVITHFLKAGTVRDQLEKQKLENEVQLVKAKTEGLESAKKVEELISDALDAMRTYKGANDE